MRSQQALLGHHVNYHVKRISYVDTLNGCEVVDASSYGAIPHAQKVVSHQRLIRAQFANRPWTIDAVVAANSTRSVREGS